MHPWNTKRSPVSQSQADNCTTLGFLHASCASIRGNPGHVARCSAVMLCVPLLLFNVVRNAVTCLTKPAA